MLGSCAVCTCLPKYDTSKARRGLRACTHFDVVSVVPYLDIGSTFGSLMPLRLMAVSVTALLPEPDARSSCAAIPFWTCQAQVHH